MKNKGLTLIEIVIATTLVVILIGGIYLLLIQTKNKTPINLDIPDPNKDIALENVFPETIDSEKDVVDKKSGDISEWVTYRNDEYYFEFQYPRGWTIVEDSEDSFGLVGEKQGEYQESFHISFLKESGRLGIGDYVRIVGSSNNIANHFVSGNKNIPKPNIPTIVFILPNTDAPPRYVSQTHLNGDDNNNNTTIFYDYSLRSLGDTSDKILKSMRLLDSN